MGKPEPAIRSCDISQQIPCQLIKTWMCNIRSQVPTLAKKCKISHWLPRSADGQVHGQSDALGSRDYQNFSDER